MAKSQVEKLVEKKQKLNLKKERLDNKHTYDEAMFEGKIEKVKNQKYLAKQTYEVKVKNIDRSINKIDKLITVEKSIISGLDKD